MRSTWYSGVCTKPGTYYQGWFMYMRFTQGQNEDHVCEYMCVLMCMNTIVKTYSLVTSK